MNGVQTTRRNNLLLVAGGLSAGIANGLLGAGGGIIIVFVLSKVLNDKEASGKDIFANALAVMLPTSLVSVIGYAVRGNMSFFGVEQYIIPAIIGGFAGAVLLDRIDISWVKKLFALLIVYSGIAMMVNA